MNACVSPSASSRHSLQKTRPASRHSTSSESSSQPAPNKTDAFICPAPPAVRLPIRPGRTTLPRTEHPQWRLTEEFYSGGLTIGRLTTARAKRALRAAFRDQTVGPRRRSRGVRWNQVDLNASKSGNGGTPGAAARTLCGRRPLRAGGVNHKAARYLPQQSRNLDGSVDEYRHRTAV